MYDKIPTLFQKKRCLNKMQVNSVGSACHGLGDILRAAGWLGMGGCRGLPYEVGCWVSVEMWLTLSEVVGDILGVQLGLQGTL